MPRGALQGGLCRPVDQGLGVYSMTFGYVARTRPSTAGSATAGFVSPVQDVAVLSVYVVRRVLSTSPWKTRSAPSARSTASYIG